MVGERYGWIIGCDATICEFQFFIFVCVCHCSSTGGHSCLKSYQRVLMLCGMPLRPSEHSFGKHRESRISASLEARGMSSSTLSIPAFVVLTLFVDTARKTGHSRYNEAQIHRHRRCNHQFPGGPDEKTTKKEGRSEREKRECSRNPLRTFFLHIWISKKKKKGVSVQNEHEYVLLSRIIDPVDTQPPTLLPDVIHSLSVQFPRTCHVTPHEHPTHTVELKNTGSGDRGNRRRDRHSRS